ncbi:hypothetical protein VTH82DRAFT_7950 [Thermothelomyces myriococcoides]
MEPNNSLVLPPSDTTSDPNAVARQFAQTITEEELVQRVQTLYTPYITYSPDNPLFFIKFGDDEMQGEGDMQMLAFTWLRQECQRNPNCNIHVPEIFRIFTRDGLTFIIMEFVPAVPVVEFGKSFDPSSWDREQTRYFDMIAEGVHLLSRVPVPADATPGPYMSGERIIRHLLFKNCMAPVVYQTIQELEDQLNRVAERGYRIVRDPPDLTTVTLEKDLNMFCYTGFNDENFMFTTDPDGRLRLYIVDFGHASFLPPSFLAFAVFEPRRRWFLCPWIADKFGASLPRVPGPLDLRGNNGHQIP